MGSSEGAREADPELSEQSCVWPVPVIANFVTFALTSTFSPSAVSLSDNAFLNNMEHFFLVGLIWAAHACNKASLKNTRPFMTIAANSRLRSCKSHKIEVYAVVRLHELPHYPGRILVNEHVYASGITQKSHSQGLVG